MAEPVRVPGTGPKLRHVESLETIETVSTPIGQGYQESNAVRQARDALHFGFTVAPIVAGLDKFFLLLVNWDQYLAPQIPNLLGIDARTFMMGVGITEIVVGLGVAFMPRIFAFVVSAWLMGIVVNLMMTGKYFDIALRDFGLALGAFALGRLSQAREKSRFSART